MNASPEGERYHSYVGQIARGASISSFGQSIGRLLGFTTQIILARAYGPTQLGFYVLGFTLVQVTKILAQFGMDSGLVRYVAHYRAGEEVSRVRGTILLALCVALGFSLALSVLVFFGASYLAEVFAEKNSDQPLLTTIFKCFSASIPFFTVMGVSLWATQGFRTVKYVTYVEQIAQPLINLGLVVVSYLLGTHVLGAVVAYALSMAAGSILALYYLQRVFPELLNREIPLKFEARTLLSASGPMVVSSISPYMNAWSVIVVLGIFATPEGVGIYNAADRTAAVSSLVLSAFGGIFSPMISSLYREGFMGELGRLYKDVSRWVFTGGLAIFLLTVLLAKDIMAVFGDEFVFGWAVLIVLAVAQLFHCSTGNTGRMLAMTGYHNTVVLATLAAAIVALTGSLALIPHYGALGAAVAAAVGEVLAGTITLWAVHRTLSFWPYSRQYLKPLVAGLITAAAALLIRLVLPVLDGLPTIITLGPCLLICYGVSILALGLSPSDQQLLKDFWMAVRTVRRST